MTELFQYNIHEERNYNLHSRVKTREFYDFFGFDKRNFPLIFHYKFDLQATKESLNDFTDNIQLKK